MSDESQTSPEIPSGVRGEAGPRVRRISNPRPKKKPKTGGESEVREETVALSAGPPADPQESAAPRPTRPLPQFSSTSEPEPAGDEESSGDSDWPDPEPASQGAAGSQEGSSKRKRRRKKGKGGGGQGQVPNSAAEGEESSPAESQTLQPPRPQAPPQAPRVKVDSELLAKFAWKIYLAEVSEEGVALISDGDARELSRRCFRLAEIFLEEQGRRR